LIYGTLERKVAVKASGFSIQWLEKLFCHIQLTSTTFSADY